MSTETSLVAAQCRLQKWALMVTECQNRPKGTSVDAWCQEYGITKADYYYRLSRVRKAFLDQNGASFEPFVEVPVSDTATPISEEGISSNVSAELKLGNLSLTIHESASLEFLKKLIKAAADA